MSNDTPRSLTPVTAPHLFRTDEFELPMIPHADSFRVNATVVARQLGFGEAKNMIKPLDEDEKVLVIPHGKNAGRADQPVWYLTEPGFYKAVGQRNVNAIRDPKVRNTVARFQRWVFHDVLPQMLRAGHASDNRLVGTTWSWDDVAAEIRQRYGLDYKPTEITRALRAAGWLKDGSTTPKHEHRWKFWHTGTAYHLMPHVLPDLVAAMVPTLREIGDPQAQQYQIEIFPTLKAVEK
jgi:prophage antirepressor-like protein